MAKYDPDRIAALAAGSLEPAEAAAFEAEIAADPRAAAELAAQRAALEAIRRAPAHVLSAAERTELRRAVAEALHLEDPAWAARAAAPRRRVPWRPLAVAAAALAALVAAVPLFGLLSVGGGDEAATTVALEATTLAPTAAFATSDAQGAENLAGQVVPAETTTADALLGPAERAMEEADKAVADLLADPAALFAPAPAGTILPCLEQARTLLEADDPAGARVSRSEGELVAWYVSDDGATVKRLVVFDPAACEFLAAYP